MKIIDLQAQMTTKRGALFPESMKSFFEVTFKTTIPYYQTEEEMMKYYKDSGVKAIFLVPAPNNFDEMAEAGKYMAELQKDYPDVVYGSWAAFNPELNLKKYVVELEKYIDNVG